MYTTVADPSAVGAPEIPEAKRRNLATGIFHHETSVMRPRRDGTRCLITIRTKKSSTSSTTKKSPSMTPKARRGT